jgi:hypothetical protein
MNEDLTDPQTLARLYAEAVSPEEMADEQWDREWAVLNNDPDFTD